MKGICTKKVQQTDGAVMPDFCAARRVHRRAGQGLLNRNGFCQVTRLIDIGAFDQRNVIGQQL